MSVTATSPQDGTGKRFMRINAIPRGSEDLLEEVPDTKELSWDAMHMMQQAKDLTKKTEQLEELVHLPADKQREIRTYQLIDHDDQARLAKRRRSDRNVDPKPQSGDSQQRRQKSGKSASFNTETGGQGKSTSYLVRRFTGDLRDDIKGLHKDALHMLQQAKELTQQTDELEELVQLPSGTQKLRCLQLQDAHLRYEKLPAKRITVSRDVARGTNSAGGLQLVRSGRSQSFQNKETEDRNISCARKVQKITRQESNNRNELYQDAMEALGLAKELSRHTEELENLVNLADSIH